MTYEPRASKVKRSRCAKTQRLVQYAIEILAEHDTAMTLRQLFYQLVAKQIIENTRIRYKALSRIIVNARLDGEISWDAIEDRSRYPHAVNMWDGVEDFAETAVAAYRRNVWLDQPVYVESWCEKNALSGIFNDLLKTYGVTANYGSGYDGWSSVDIAAQRFVELPEEHQPGVIVYFGDWDPSGEDMPRSLGQRLGNRGAHPEIIRCALSVEDIALYDLPTNPNKRDADGELTDSRAAGFDMRYKSTLSARDFSVIFPVL